MLTGGPNLQIHIEIYKILLEFKCYFYRFQNKFQIGYLPIRHSFMFERLNMFTCRRASKVSAHRYWEILCNSEVKWQEVIFYLPCSRSITG